MSISEVCAVIMNEMVVVVCLYNVQEKPRLTDLPNPPVF